MKPTVLSSVKILLLLILLLVIESVCGGCVYMIYALCTTLVAGREIQLVSGMLFVKGVFLFAPVAISSSGAFLLFFLIRHQWGTKADFVVYAVWYVLSWLILIPLTFRVYESISKENHIVATETLVSPGYFRNSESENEVLFYSQVRDDATVEGVSISDHNITTYNKRKIHASGSDFADPIIRDSLEMNSVISFFVSSYNKMFDIGAESSRDFLSWLCFSSIGLVYLAVFEIRRLSVWRLVNVFFILVVYVGLFNLDLYIYTGDILPYVSHALMEAMPFIPGNAFVLILNLSLTLIFILAGIFISSYRKKAVEAASDSVFYGAEE
ncbi:hypothetical protein [Treponema sp.]|jgi:hypothetical protein|uniref:hypothetical protein n=1 Tax=Treponema sp. TaxID=166 RepID=UPI00257F2015|nr:hypothetical protein [Treponema sp.]MBE6353142.1 hypothetical protein [Treponema sp.]